MKTFNITEEQINEIVRTGKKVTDVRRFRAWRSG